MNTQNDNLGYVTKLGEKTNINSTEVSATQPGVEKTNENGKGVKVPFYLHMWFISLVFWLGIFAYGLGPIAATVLFIIRIVKYPNNRKTALLSVVIQIVLIVAITAWAIWDSGKDDRAINNLLDEGKYAEAIEYVEENYDSTSYGYYTKIAEIYEKQGDYNSAVSSILKYTEIIPDITEINDNVISKLKTYKGKVSNENENAIDKKIDEIIEAKAAKEAAEKKAAEEEAAKEAAEKEAAEQKATEEKAAKEAAEKEAADKKAAEEKAAKEAAEKEAAEQKAAEQKAQEDAEKSIVQNAQTLGVDLVMESPNSAFDDKYFKTEGTIEAIDNGSYLIRYLSTIDNHKRMYKAWIRSDDTSDLYVGENIFVVAKYVGFAEESSVPTLDQYKIDKSSDSFYSVLSSKAKVVNRDVTFDNLLRYGEYQEYVYIEGEVTGVYENCLNVVDEYGNGYVIFDERANKNVILQGDYIRVYGSFDGIDKAGYVWPLITWLVDGNQ